ncbi:LYK5 protein [Spatholobus suberectus]|nr:LYK5 protein [Spatholobus suberectus]
MAITWPAYVDSSILVQPLNVVTRKQQGVHVHGDPHVVISKPSNISFLSSPLVPNQPFLIPLTFTCNKVNTTFGSLSYANISYTTKSNNTFSLVSTFKFQNLTTNPSIEVVNPILVPIDVSIG